MSGNSLTKHHNEATSNQRLVHCSTLVNKSAVRRETVNGVEHVVISSYTLPDNIVMNGGLYPADEIEKGYKTLERTPAPVEHPTDENGNFIPATDPDALHNFYAGAYNTNVKRENGRVHIEKRVNVQEALKSERGKRLLDRIEELETNSEPRPVHTSVGLLLNVEQLDKPRTNAAGQSYDWVAKNMEFDHDAILLDSVGAAQPTQGVGLAVNKTGDKIDVESFYFNGFDDSPRDEYEKEVEKATRNIEANAVGMSLNDIYSALSGVVQNIFPECEYAYVVDIFQDEVIFETDKGLFVVPYRIDEGRASIVGIPNTVSREVSYTPKTNAKGGKSMFKEMVLNALAEAGTNTDGLSDEQLLGKYNELQKKESETQLAKLSEICSQTIAEQLGQFAEKVNTLESAVNAKADTEKTDLVETIVNSDKYEGMTKEVLSGIAIETLKSMAANCKSSYGVNASESFDSSALGDGYAAPSKMFNSQEG